MLIESPEFIHGEDVKEDILRLKMNIRQRYSFLVTNKYLDFLPLAGIIPPRQI